jgi:predicted nucleic-acid-binding protein
MYTILYETKQQSKQNKEQPQEKQPKKSKSDQADEILNALVWMLERNIITQQEYNTLIVKVSGCL